MENMIICQSCAMPMAKDEDFGTNKDGSKNNDYCAFCYQNGEFTAEMTMEDMITYCAEHYEEWNIPMPKDAFINELRETYPKLKRWKMA